MIMLSGYARPDTRPNLERIQILPPSFLRDPIIVAGQTFTGEPKQAGSDNHGHTPERSDRPIIYIDCRFAAGGASEALKLSRHWYVACIDCHLLGGAEEPLDICRGGDLYFRGCDPESVPPGGRDLELKGSARRVTFDRCPNLRSLRVGMYSKYDARAVYPDGTVRVAELRRFARPPVRELRLIDQNHIDVELWHADEPIQFGDTQARIRRPIPRWLVPAFFWIRAKFFRETNPVPAEEFHLDPREIA